MAQSCLVAQNKVGDSRTQMWGRAWQQHAQIQEGQLRTTGLLGSRSPAVQCCVLSSNGSILDGHQNVRAPCTGGLSAFGMRDLLCEATDQAIGELPWEAAQRRLQEIEDRVIDEDEKSCPKTDLKREFGEVFTKEMIESVSCSSMELYFGNFSLNFFLISQSCHLVLRTP
ncbi:hypothetical protein HPG69_017611 [Diceros bicornis minor]|uniref:Uncharacterized protein n=1 Tax=Diceros bicornis minor TaxID=77932 RepID=A0A7J7EL13_DICBM|nr:hypothetical protein HPG69_017611 [Diceros bicornis minor]